MPNDAKECLKMLMNVNENAQIVIESELLANLYYLRANECVFSRNEQQKVYCRPVP